MDIRRLAIGEMDKRVILQAPVIGQDSNGQPTRSWTQVAAVWANIRYLSGVETIKSEMETGVTRASIRVHYRAGVVPTMRVLYRGTYFNITAVLPDPTGAHFMDLVAESGAVSTATINA